MATDRTTDWTPDMPLRADATNEQMFARFRHIVGMTKWPGWFYGGEGDPLEDDETAVIIAREFASACVAAERERAGADRGLVERIEALPRYQRDDGRTGMYEVFGGDREKRSALVVWGHVLDAIDAARAEGT